MLPYGPSGFFCQLILRMHLCLRLSSAFGTAVIVTIVCLHAIILRMHLCLRLSSASSTDVVVTIVRQHAVLLPVVLGRGPVVASGRIVPFLHCSVVALRSWSMYVIESW